MNRPETHYARSGDVCIAYQITGDGPFDLVFAPGTVSHLDLDWDAPARATFFENLGRICRLIRFDKRGTGLSDRPTAMATLEQRADDIRAVMDAVGIERAVVLGASEGGSMAAMFAATHPERTQAVLIWGAMARWVAAPDHPWGMTPEEHEELVRDVAANWPSEWYVRGPGVGLGEEADPAVVESVQRYCRAAGSPSAVAAYEQMNGEIDIRPILPTIRVPAAVMIRSEDPLAPAAAAKDMASRIPGANYMEFPGKTHSMMAIEPEKVIAAIQEFVTGVKSGVVEDRLLASVLFIDLANSTEALARMGDEAWKSVLASYYATFRRELSRYRGVETNTSGDGVMATFDGPARAVRCAMATSLAVRELGLKIRAGVHVGEVARMGDNIGGIAVHIASRIQGEAAAGQIIASRTTKDLVAGSGIAWEPLGARSLKGLDEPIELFRVTAL